MLIIICLFRERKTLSHRDLYKTNDRTKGIVGRSQGTDITNMRRNTPVSRLVFAINFPPSLRRQKMFRPVSQCSPFCRAKVWKNIEKVTRGGLLIRGWSKKAPKKAEFLAWETRLYGFEKDIPSLWVLLSAVKPQGRSDTERFRRLFLGKTILALAVYFVGNRQFLAAFGAAGSQYATAVSCLHAMTETMLVASLSVVRLECSFHFLLCFFIINSCHIPLCHSLDRGFGLQI